MATQVYGDQERVSGAREHEAKVAGESGVTAKSFTAVTALAFEHLNAGYFVRYESFIFQVQDKN